MLKKIPSLGADPVALSTGEVNDLRTSIGLTAVDTHTSDVIVLSTDSAATIKSKIETINAAVDTSGGVEWSEGVGRLVNLAGAKLTTGFLSVSQAQNLQGVKGSTILTLDSGAVVVNPGDGVTGYVTLANDFRSHSGIAGQGEWGNFDIDASPSQGMGLDPAIQIHGLYAPLRVGSANMPTIYNVGVYGAKNDGIHLEGGNDKLVFYRMRQEGSLGRGVYVAGSDCKGSDIGTVAQGTAMEIDSAAVEINKFDIWRSNSPTSDPTLKITGASNGCVFNSGTIEGNTLFIGKNSSNTNRGINSHAKFIATHFKLKSGFTGRTSLFEARGADLVEFIGCKWGQTGNSGLITPYNYLIEVTNAGGSDIDGLIKIIGGSGMLRMLGRVGATNRQKMDCLKHIINKPERLLFEWGRMGTVEWVAEHVINPTDPTLFTHMPCDGRTVNVIDQPFLYLNVMAHFGNWSALLDDAVATFQMPRIGSIDAYTIPAIRAVI